MVSLRVTIGVKKNALYDRRNRVDLLELSNPDKKPGAMVEQSPLEANGFLVGGRISLDEAIFRV